MDLQNKRHLAIIAAAIAFLGMQFGPQAQAVLLQVVNALLGGAL